MVRVVGGLPPSTLDQALLPYPRALAQPRSHPLNTPQAPTAGARALAPVQERHLVASDARGSSRSPHYPRSAQSTDASNRTSRCRAETPASSTPTRSNDERAERHLRHMDGSVASGSAQCRCANSGPHLTPPEDGRDKSAWCRCRGGTSAAKLSVTTNGCSRRGCREWRRDQT